jgi:hypothetical protein
MFQGAGEALPFPYMLYAAPNALFPLMSFFLMIRFGSSRNFIPLYITGKIIGVASLTSWIFFTFVKNGVFPFFLRWSFFLGLADLASAAGVFLLGTPILKAMKSLPDSPDPEIESQSSQLSQSAGQNGGA